MKSFLSACGIEDSFQFAVENQDGTESRLRLLYQPFAVIGRDLRADVVLDHPEVSRRHVYLQVIEGRVFWIDLESRTGTPGAENRKDSAGFQSAGRSVWARMWSGDLPAIPEDDRKDRSRSASSGYSAGCTTISLKRCNTRLHWSFSTARRSRCQNQYTGCCRCLAQPVAVSSGSQIRVSRGFTVVYCKPLAVYGSLTCWAKRHQHQRCTRAVEPFSRW